MFRCVFRYFFGTCLICAVGGCAAPANRALARHPVQVATTGNLAPVAFVHNVSGRSAISLDGKWSVIVDPYETGYYNYRHQADVNGYFKNRKAETPSDLLEYNFATAQKLNVPGDWNTQDEKLLLYEGTIWYQRDFVVKKDGSKRYVIDFGAVNYKAVVYVNGVRAGEHEGGFTGFQFDVTDNVADGSNFVVVKVDNRRERDQVPTSNTDWWNYGGITRSVKLLILPNMFVRDYTVALASSDPPAIAGWVSVARANAIPAGAFAELEIPELGIKTRIALDAFGYGNFSVGAHPQLWAPQSPKLYDVTIGYQGDLIRDRIGFRNIAVKGEEILLNGKPVFLKGISVHEESPLHPGRAWSTADALATLGAAKELGCNFVRLAHYPHNEDMLKAADVLGLLVWSEIPVYWTILFDNPEVYAKAEQQLTEMISRDKNRASIILWSMANETPSSQPRFDFITKLAAKARRLDNTRLITAALEVQSDADGVKTIDDPLGRVVDVIGINNYCGWYGGTPASCANLKWLSRYHKPVIISEFGGAAVAGRHGDIAERWTEEYQADVYKNNLAMIDNMTFLRGMSPWILRDFRSPRRPLAGVQDYWNRKGLISDIGTRKQAWFLLRDYYENRGN